MEIINSICGRSVYSENYSDPHYSFNTFVVKAHNRLAHASSIAVINNPGCAFNPLYIFGEKGTGKTHLVCATGKCLMERYPEMKVNYISAGQIENEITALNIKMNKSENFTKEIRDLGMLSDVLIIEDIQMLIGKTEAQKEMIQILYTMCERNAQMIFTGDRKPDEFEGFDEKLSSVLNSGLVVSV